MEIESITIKSKDSDEVLSYTFLDNNEYKTIIRDDLEIEIIFRNRKENKDENT